SCITPCRSQGSGATSFFQLPLSCFAVCQPSFSPSLFGSVRNSQRPTRSRYAAVDGAIVKVQREGSLFINSGVLSHAKRSSGNSSGASANDTLAEYSRGRTPERISRAAATCFWTAYQSLKVAS